MKIVKNLSIANIRKFEGFVRREDLDFADDGNYFKGFSYKGMPITTLRADNTTYLSIHVDYLKNEFTCKEWMQTEEYKLCGKFNGVSEFDINELVKNVEIIIAKVAKMNKAVENEEIDVTKAKVILADEIEYAEQAVENFKNNFKWYEASEYKLRCLIDYLKSEEREIKRAKEIDLDTISRKQKKEIIERLTNCGYVMINKDGFYLREMSNAITNC
jgi:hypothetical protein